MDNDKKSLSLPPISLSDFKQETAAFEVRFGTCYRLWDSAGSVWSKILEKWPSLKIVEGSPAKTVFTLENKFALTIELEKAYSAGYFPATNLKDYLEIIQPFIEITTKELEIQSYTRIGFRQMFFRDYSTKEEASAAMISTGAIRVPEPPQFGIEGRALLPEFALRWEGKSAGTMVRLRAEDRILDFEPSLGVTELESVKVTKHRLALDVDYYVLGTIAVGQVRVKDWIDQAQHLVARDINAFLGG